MKNKINKILNINRFYKNVSQYFEYVGIESKYYQME